MRLNTPFRVINGSVYDADGALIAAAKTRDAAALSEIVRLANLHDDLVALVKDAAGGLTVGLREATLARLSQIQSTLPEGR